MAHNSCRIIDYKFSYEHVFYTTTNFCLILSHRERVCGGNTTIIDIKIGNNSNSTMTNRTSTPNLITATIQDTTTSSSEDPDFIDQHRFAQTVVELLLDLLQKANLSANLIQNETEIAVTTTATPKISKLKLL
ncbi:unnamed protein product [Didymodactylos carnosus]|uniref:Uncharacterized protein n=1 Tax=Didymodactylos carnosus TaxID=1234261 RepID=A0A8S2DUT7_9BILA|nr:unnamed protein product [Didymodactylos carnosus]CAF3777350.1 unnamed protein product [Didymodactylos carnosus]